MALNLLYATHWARCRVCKESAESTKLVKYSTRHYAHPKCALQKWGGAFFDRITPWQATRFPYFVAKDAGVLPALIARADQHKVNA